MDQKTIEAVYAATRVTKEDMVSFDHRDDWGVPALYNFEAQVLVDQKVAAVLRLIFGESESVSVNVYSRRPHRSA